MFNQKMKKMKKFVLTISLSIAAICSTLAQFDDRFYFPSKEWEVIENMNYEEYNFTIESDTLNAILFKTETAPKATMLFYHGAGGNISTYTFIIEPLVNAGFQVFAVDFRGYGKSTGVPTHVNIASDAQFIFNQMTKNEKMEETPLIVYGASMGTQIATKITKDNQSKISGLILDGTVSSFTDIALHSTPEEQKSIIKQYVTSPYSAKNDIKEIDNLPKIFIHSQTDESVPFEQGKLVFANASEPKELWAYEGNHLDAVVNNEKQYIQKINSLLAQN